MENVFFNPYAWYDVLIKQTVMCKQYGSQLTRYVF